MSIRIVRFVLACAFVAAAAPAWPSPVDDPPADARRFAIVSSGGQHGTLQFWTAADGALRGRLHIELRGMVTDQDETIALAPDGSVARYRLQGKGPGGDLTETFEVVDGRAAWKSPIDAGEKAGIGPDSFYLPVAPWQGRQSALLIERLAAARKPLQLLPGGQARAEVLATLGVQGAGRRETWTAWSVTGIWGTPWVLWTDAAGRFAAQLGGTSTIVAGFDANVPRLQATQDRALAGRVAQLSRRLGTPAPAVVAFEDVRAFVDGDRFADHQTVVVRGGRIVSVGSAGTVAIPAHARVIPGRGKTLVPGLWDCHMHVDGDFTGFSRLALGVTSGRDPGNRDALTVSRRNRWRTGALLMPTVYASSMIDGKGPLSAQVATVVTSRAEALKAVDAARARGMTGVKLYGSFDPAWVADTAARAHALGLHVHGHLPAGMRPLQAIEAGYDEITHINFVAMQAMPDEVVAKSNGMQRFLGIGRFAKDIDLGAPAMAGLIDTMARRGIAVDTTLVVFESLLTLENGDLDPAVAPYLGTLPPAFERYARQGGFEPPGGVGRADFRASFRKLLELVRTLHAAGVPIVAGTDGSGLEIVRELELYVEAGLSPAQALAAATLVPARLVKADAQTGSISVGKRADLVLVDGDPSAHIGDLRHTEWVMTQGRLMRADRLRGAVGISGSPARDVD